MRKISLVVYDFDGTLVDTLFDIADSVNLTLAELKLPQLPRETIRKYVGKGVERLMSQTLEGSSYSDIPTAVSLFKKHYSQNLVHHTDFYPHGREILHYFKDKSQAICSNKPEGFVRRILESLDGLHYFDAVIGGDSVNTKKPDPEGLNTILQQLNISADEAVLVGDSPVDVETGRRAGVYTCIVNFGLGFPDEIAAAGPDCSIDSLSELKDLFC
ncbi:MAG: HAD-IA family hydrolase [Nitrospinae bacterium]|nr:HAD-IA family hydrolase [Nitrospinota bacterium]MZH05036.1 HAD-IA family hydrolase [Nitrospinota bacterium]MZH14634.1 HAD-IA family hydrolase [Nitrospinota bacterium]